MGLNLCDRCAADCRHERNPNEIVVKCGAYKLPMTNADRIRSMSDEKLAMYIKELMFNDFKPACKKSAFFSAEHKPECDEDCASCLLHWLQQPEEET